MPVIEERENAISSEAGAGWTAEEELAFYREWIAKAADVCEHAGDLEHRGLCVSPGRR